MTKSITAALIEAGKNRSPPEDARARLAERDARLAADTRSEVQRWLGDQEPGRSALTQANASHPATAKSASGTRVDLWRK